LTSQSSWLLDIHTTLPIANRGISIQIEAEVAGRILLAAEP
jgi:hypothetical protein